MDTSAFNNGWENKTDKDKLESLQNLENEFADEEGRKIKCKVDFKQFPKIISNGRVAIQTGEFSVDPNTNEYHIYINEDVLKSKDPKDKYELIDTIIHEGRHAYQRYANDHPEVEANKSNVKRWEEDTREYISDAG